MAVFHSVCISSPGWNKPMCTMSSSLSLPPCRWWLHCYHIVSCMESLLPHRNRHLIHFQNTFFCWPMISLALFQPAVTQKQHPHILIMFPLTSVQNSISSTIHLMPPSGGFFFSFFPFAIKKGEYSPNLGWADGWKKKRALQTAKTTCLQSICITVCNTVCNTVMHMKLNLVLRKSIYRIG